MKPLKAWALIDPDDKDRIIGGSYRCAIYWSRAGAGIEQKIKPDQLKGKKLIPVVVLPLKGYRG